MGYYSNQMGVIATFSLIFSLYYKKNRTSPGAICSRDMRPFLFLVILSIIGAAALILFSGSSSGVGRQINSCSFQMPSFFFLPVFLVSLFTQLSTSLSFLKDSVSQKVDIIQSAQQLPSHKAKATPCYLITKDTSTLPFSSMEAFTVSCSASVFSPFTSQ